MKRLLYIPVVLVWLLSCNSSTDSDPTVLNSFSTVSGQWYSIEAERSSLDNKSVWEAIPATQTDTLIFRGDGVILNADGKPRCCAPSTLTINGRLLDVKPQTALPGNPECALLNCVTCPTWEISWNDDQMIISTCNSPRVKYVK